MGKNLYKPSQILRKQPFLRVLPKSEVGVLSESNFRWDDNVQYAYCTQADFIREYNVSGHRINDKMFYPDKMKQVEVKNSDGTSYYKTLIQRMIRMAIPYQSMIVTKQLSADCGNNLSFSISDAEVSEGMENIKNMFMQGWQDCDMEVAWYACIKSDKIVGDTAFCGYKDKGKFGWRVFSYTENDLLYPHYDRYGNLDAFGREYGLYNEESKLIERMLDVWDNKYAYTYKQSLKGVKGAKNKALAKLGFEDMGWELASEPILHGFENIPIAYHRTGKPCWFDVQSLIEMTEQAYSQLAENNKAYALRILFTKGAAVAMQSTMDGTPVRIDTEEVDADAKYLEPADASGSFKMQIEALENSIYRGSFIVKTPDVKGSDLSGLAVELLFTDSTQKAMCDSQEYKPFINEMIRIFKEGYGTQIGKTSDFQRLNIFGEIIPFVPKSETEEVNCIVQLKSVGALSQQTASENGTRLGYGKNAEWNRIMKEERNKLVQEERAAQNQINLQNEITAKRDKPLTDQGV